MDDRATRDSFRFPADFVAFDREWLALSIPALFERQVKRRPDAIAARFGSSELTYAQLNRAANAAARRLLAVAPDGPAPVALLLDQGLPLVVWIIAIFKAGLAYVPLDTRLPASALARMLDDLGPRALVAATAHRANAETFASGRFPAIDAETRDDSSDENNLGLAIDANALATVFYTSGSTGAPKGVADSHRNVLHNVLRYTNSLGFAASDRMSLVQNPSFSGTVSSLFGALLNGATSVLRDQQAPDGGPIGPWLRRERITIFHGVPAIFRQIAPDVDRYPDLRLIRLEGDRAGALDLERFQDGFNPRCVLVNGLGATECGLVRQFFAGAETPAVQDAALPVGFGVPDMSVRVIDDAGANTEPGAIGEIVVESRFLASGYWNNAAMTAQRFVPLGDGVRRYITGDLGKLDGDGCLTHLGRRDQQPKIAGRFVDTGEIERVLQALPGIAQAVLHFHPTDAGEHRLVAYLVVQPGMLHAHALEVMRESMRTRVASDMIPSAFVFLDALPVTPDGKIDRRKLPPPARARPVLSIPHAPPLTEAHAAIARIWSEVLQIDAPGIDDPFLELGGDSIGAARIVARLIQSDLSGFAEAGIVDLFEYRTIRTLAAALDERDRAHDTSIASDVRGTPLPAKSPSPGHAIAVVGMAARFPGAPDVATFWKNLRDGVESITRFDDSTETSVESHIAARGVLEGVDLFDAAFFGLTPREANALDPQQRVWLECVHHALEDAALSRQAAAGARVGVFAGGRESTYLWNLLGGDATAVAQLLRQDTDDAHLLRISNDTDSIATRTSFLFDLRGPSVNVQSACSTSLVAIAQACNALVAAQCDAAIAGGVCITFPQNRGYRYFEGGIQSHDGHCRAFDDAANGTVFSDGVGVVVLKRLDDARRDGDRIHAVVRGWAVNNDGANKASFTAPNLEAQADVIAAAHDHAAVDPRHITYVEAHGTATRVGDPIEIAGLTRAFRRRTSERGFCALGSVKTNIGHLDTAAGVAGFIKTVLALKHRQIPATLYFRQANPAIDFAASPFVVADRLLEWESPERARLAGVSSFGAGGTNCHVIIEEAPADLRVDQPAHAFQRRRFWYEKPTQKADERESPAHGDPLLGHRIRLPGSTEIRFETRASREWPTYLVDHRLFGTPVMPGAAHFAMLAQAARTLADAGAVAFENLYLLRPLVFPDGNARHVQLVLRPGSAGWSLQIVSAIVSGSDSENDLWIEHVIGSARAASPLSTMPALEFEHFKKSAATRHIPGADFYARIWANQGGTGSSFRWIDKIWQCDGEALCHTTRPAAVGDVASCVIHPGLVEAACQVLHACGTIETKEALERDGVTFVPFSVARLLVIEPARNHIGVWCHARMRSRNNDEVIGDLTIADESGRAIALIEGFCLRRIRREAVKLSPEASTPRIVQIASAAPLSPRDTRVDPLRYLVRQCAEVTGHSQSSITTDASFIELGLDSIMAVMLANRIQRDFNVALDASHILSSDSIIELAEDIRVATAAPE